MLDEQTPAEPGNEPTPTDTPATDTPDGDAAPAPRKRATRKTAAKKAAAPEPGPDPAEAASDPAAQAGPDADSGPDADTGEKPAPARRTRKTSAKKTAARADGDSQPAEPVSASEDPAPGTAEDDTAEAPKSTKKTASKRTTKKATTKRIAPATDDTPAGDTPAEDTPEAGGDTPPTAEESTRQPAPVTAPLFVPPDASAAKPAKKSAKKTSQKKAPVESDDEPEAEAGTTESADSDTGAPETEAPSADADPTSDDGGDDDSPDEGDVGARRRRRRGGRRRRKGSGEGGGDASENGSGDTNGDQNESGKQSDKQSDDDGEGGEGGGSSRRRRRRRRSGEGDDGSDDSETTSRARKPRSAEDEITSFSGSTRLEAKKQRRREGREAGRRRAPIISEAEFLARRESVDRTMVIRQRDDLTQIAVLEDKVLVEHYVARESQTSLIGNVYLGRVQNVLPSMEAAFIDIGKGRNAVLYAGEVNWDALGAKDGNQRKIEQVLKPGQSVLVQVSKDPIGHKGARLTSQISLPGRFLVYVPDGNTSGISRKLPENERNRLKTLLKDIVPDTAGVIVRTAAEGASEEELTRDVERLKALWEDISKKVESGGGSSAPQLLYGEPDLTLKVVRDLFTEDIAKLVVSGDDAWELVENYVNHVAPDLADRLEKHDDSERDAFADYRIDEQINKALDRKVWLPSGGSLVIDRTEAMTVVDVNTGKFTGSGGNLEETVTKNNLEAAEEIVRQLRLRDIGGIIVIDFIDMVLESNRDLVLRRLIECLGRDRTRHQVAEVTSLGLVQMTRKRIGTGLLEAFSEPCEACQGRGLNVHQEPVDQKRKASDDEPRRGRRNRGRGKGGDDQAESSGSGSATTSEVRRPTPAEFAAMARVEPASEEPAASDGTEVAPHQESQPESQPQFDSQPQPEPQADVQPEPEPEPEPEPAPEADRQPEPEAPPEPEPEFRPEPEPAPPPAAPRIVTSVRRIGARRPAGPPAGQATAVLAEETTGATTGAPTGADSEELVDTAEPSVDGVDGVDGVGQPHVPVKKKGARKR